MLVLQQEGGRHVLSGWGCCLADGQVHDAFCQLECNEAVAGKQAPLAGRNKEDLFSFSPQPLVTCLTSRRDNRFLAPHYPSTVSFHLCPVVPVAFTEYLCQIRACLPACDGRNAITSVNMYCCHVTAQITRLPA